MLYGLHYALFVEHQTLDRMGASLSEAFVRAAQRQMPQAHDAIDTYASTKYDYVRQVDVHSHWTGLAMLMIVLGVAFDRVAFSERVRAWIAGSLLVGSVLFPLGVILQTSSHGSGLGPALAIVGSGLVALTLAAAAWGFTRQV
jgi:hypothetical protein